MKIIEAMIVALVEKMMLWAWSYLRAYGQARAEANRQTEGYSR